MDFTKLPQREKNDYLRSLGVDPSCFGDREYNLALLRAAKEDLEKDLGNLTETFQELYKDLRIDAEVQYREPGASGSSIRGGS